MLCSATGSCTTGQRLTGEKMFVYMIKTGVGQQLVQPLIYKALPTLKTDFTGASLCDLGASNNTKAD